MCTWVISGFFSVILDTEVKLEFMNILQANADAAYYVNRGIIQNTYNGLEETGGEKECYVSKTPKAGWIHYMIPYSEIKTVEMFSIPGKFC